MPLKFIYLLILQYFINTTKGIKKHCFCKLNQVFLKAKLCCVTKDKLKNRSRKKQAKRKKKRKPKKQNK